MRRGRAAAASLVLPSLVCSPLCSMFSTPFRLMQDFCAVSFNVTMNGRRPQRDRGHDEQLQGRIDEARA